MDNNRENIKNVLDELGITYKNAVSEKDEFKTETYFIKLVVENNVIMGGILEEYDSKDNHISVVFFFERSEEEETDILAKVNKCNQMCRYGNFFLDDEGDVAYTLVIPRIGDEVVSREVFKFYFDSVLSLIKVALKELKNE